MQRILIEEYYDVWIIENGYREPKKYKRLLPSERLLHSACSSICHLIDPKLPSLDPILPLVSGAFEERLNMHGWAALGANGAKYTNPGFIKRTLHHPSCGTNSTHWQGLASPKSEIYPQMV